MGSTYTYARTHSPNEFARIDLLNKATKCIAAIIEKFGKPMHTICNCLVNARILNIVPITNLLLLEVDKVEVEALRSSMSI